MITLKTDHLYRSQCGEDRILWQVFMRRRTGYFIEIGAYDGVTLSNTYFLEQKGWCGLLVEPLLQMSQKAAAARPRSCVVNAAASRKGSAGTATFTLAQNAPVLSFLSADQEHLDRCAAEGVDLIEVEVPLTSVDTILSELRHRPPVIGGPWIPNVGWRVDFVSIDTEGCELDVLDGFCLERVKPRVLLIENDRDSGEAIEPYLAGRGYRKFFRQKINDFYVRTDGPCDDLMLDGFTLPQDGQ